MSDRVNDIVITGFHPDYAPAFAQLNYAWISESYEIEPHDRELLDEPEEYIIKPGGEILFALVDETVVGTAALIVSGPGSFELGKMAVIPSSRGRGVGEKLLRAAIDHSRASGKEEIWLESNTRQESAVRLYKRLGFTETDLDAGSPYSRVNIRMRLAIS